VHCGQARQRDYALLPPPEGAHPALFRSCGDVRIAQGRLRSRRRVGVALDPQGRPSFRLLQGATTTSIPIYFYAFDVLNENARLLLDQPLSQRRAVLESLLAGAPEALRVSPLLRAAIGTDPRGAA
jgi:hypothetical protein